MSVAGRSDRQIESAKRAQSLRLGSSGASGKRKRCRRGKSCGASCIAGPKVCMVDLPFVIGPSVTKARDQIVAVTGGKAPSKPKPAPSPKPGLEPTAQPKTPKPKAPKETYEKVPRGALNRDYWDRKLERAEKKAKPDEASELKRDRSFVDGIWGQANAKGIVSPKAAMNFLNQMGVNLEEYHSTMGPNAPYHAGALLHYMKTGSGFYLM